MQVRYRRRLGWRTLGIGLPALLVAFGVPASPSFAAGDDARAAAPPRAAALLARGAGYGRPADLERVRVVQRRLVLAGHRLGAIDGLFGPRTEAAVRDFQRRRGLAVDGVVGPATARALRAVGSGGRLLARGVGYGRPGGSPGVRVVQRRLRQLGYRPGAVDGLFGARTEAAVRRLQRRLGIGATGVVEPQLRARLAAEHRPDGRVRTSARPAAARERHESRSERPESGFGTADAVLAALAALALALAALLALSLRGGDWRRTLLSPDYVAEGETREAGAFKGRMQALAVTATRFGRRRRTSYLIVDPRKPRPFWVELDAIRRVSREPAAAPPDASDRASAASLRAVGCLNADQSAEPIEQFCAQRGWTLVELMRNSEPTNGSTQERALARLRATDASCLVVAQLGSLCDSVSELDPLLEHLDGLQARLVCLQPQLDTATSSTSSAIRALSQFTAAARSHNGQHQAAQPPAQDPPNPPNRAQAAAANGGRPAVRCQAAAKDVGGSASKNVGLRGPAACWEACAAIWGLRVRAA